MTMEYKIIVFSKLYNVFYLYLPLQCNTFSLLDTFDNNWNNFGLLLVLEEESHIIVTFNWTIFEGFIALFDLIYFIKKVKCNPSFS